MGSRPSQFKKGGGFLDGVDATFVDYEFTDEFNGEPYKPGKFKDSKTGKQVDKPHSLNVFVSFRVDGADENTSTTLRAASNFDDWDITNDGHTVTPNEDGTEFASGTSFAKFIQTLVKPTEGGDGFPEDRLPEDEFNYEAIIGTRVRLEQKEDVERTKKFGPKVDKKTGKEYARKDLVVAEVYDLPTVATKSNGKAAKPVAGKAAKVDEPEGEDLQELSGKALVEIIEANGGKIAKQKLSQRTLTTPLLKGHAQRDDVRKWVFDDKNLATLVGADVIQYDKAKQELSLPA